MSKVKPKTLDAVKREAIVATLSHTGGSVIAAAKILKISNQSLYRYIQRYGITISANVY